MSDSNKGTEPAISIKEMKIPTDSSVGDPKKKDTVCGLWVFQNCEGDNAKKLRRIVSLVRNRNEIVSLPVTSDGKVCIVTFIGEYQHLSDLRSSVFGLGMESFSFVPDKFWVTPPQDLAQFKKFFDTVQSDLLASEKQVLQKREKEIKAKPVMIDPTEYNESEKVDLNDTDIEDLRKELDAISSL